jgi:hypothetical protein
MRSIRLTNPTRRAAAAATLTVAVLGAGAACTPPPSGPATAKQIAMTQLAQRGWSSQSTCLINLWQKESGWNVSALNRSSGAYGIPQALPATKLATAGGDWRTSPSTQIRWGLDYINARYGGPCNAWRHSVATNWYSVATTAPTSAATTN